MKKFIALALAVLFVFGSFGSIFAGSVKEYETETTEAMISVGDYLYLGSYLGERILWRCVDIDENGPLMLSDKVLCLKCYDANGESDLHQDGWGYIRKSYGSNCWYDSNIRQWLNSDDASIAWTHCPPYSSSTQTGINGYDSEAGFLTGFSQAEVSIIKPITQIIYINEYECRREGYCDGGSFEVCSSLPNLNQINETFYTGGYFQYVNDKVFCPGINHLLKTYQNLGDYVYAYPSKTAIQSSTASQIVFSEDQYCRYWTSTSCNSGASYENVEYFHTSDYYLSALKAYNSEVGVRPAFYLIENAVFTSGNGSVEFPFEWNGQLGYGITKAEDVFYENCYIADIWLNNYHGAGSINGNTVECDYFSTMLEQPSLSALYNQGLHEDMLFMSAYSCWSGTMVVFETNEYIYKQIDRQQLNEAVVLDYICRIVENEGEKIESLIFDVAENMGSANEKCSKIYKVIDNIVKASGDLTGENLLSYLKKCPQNTEFISQFISKNQHDFLIEWNDNSFIEFIGDAASAANDICDFFERMAAFLCLKDVTNELVIVLNEIKKQADDWVMKLAIERIIACINNTDLTKFVLLGDFTGNIINKTLVDEFVKYMWIKYAPPELWVLKLGYEFGKITSNLLFNTQGIIDKFYLVEATSKFVAANKAAVISLGNKYLSTGNEADAGAYVYAMKMYKYVIEADLDAAAQMTKACEKEGFVNILSDGICNALSVLYGMEYKDRYDLLVENIDTILSSYDVMFESAETNWKYFYLREDYPDVYPIYAYEEFSNERYIPRISGLKLNSNGQTELVWNVPSCYFDSNGNLHMIGVSMIDGVEVMENVDGQNSMVDLEGTDHSTVFYNGNKFGFFPKQYSIRAYTDSNSGRVYTDYRYKDLENPLKSVTLGVTMIAGKASMAIFDTTSRKYDDVVYHIYRKPEGGYYEEIATVSKNNSFFFGSITSYVDSTAVEGVNYTYRVVSELVFTNGKSLTVASNEAICFNRVAESVIRELSLRLVGTSGGNSKDCSLFEDEEPAITEYGYELTWEPYEGAEGYQIYRKEAFGDNYNLIAEVEASQYSYLDSTADVMLGYEFMVIPFTTGNGVKNVDTGNYSAGILKHTVTFVDWDGAVLSEQTVEHGHAAVAPADPEREDCPFFGWDHNITCIQDDITVTALYGVKCGDNAYGAFNPVTGVLSIFGAGDMTDWSDESSVPWCSYKSNIKNVVIGSSVTSIGDYAFYYCESLISVTIPDSMTTIGYSAFRGCNSLASVTIPDSVTSIGDYAFYCCTSLAFVTIGNGVTSIGGYAFYGCSTLTTVTIPDSVTSIGGYAFYGCSSLTSVTIPDSVTSFGYTAFCNCSSLTCINVTVDNLYLSSLDGVLFNKDKSILICCPGGKVGTYDIPDSVTRICYFSGCSSLTSVTIPDSVTRIDYRAFDGCSSLTSLTIPDSVTSIGDYAFHGCSSLTSVTIPDSVTSIGDYAFKNCSSLNSVTIPDSVTSIGRWAFSFCTSLTSVTIPESVTSIGDYAFWYCSSLTSAVFLGEPPSTFGSVAFDYSAPDFCIYYYPEYASSWSPNGQTEYYGYPICMISGPDIEPGDVDGDGLVTMADVTLLSMYLNGEDPQITEPGMANADANEDGTVDIRDIAAIYAIIAAS